MGYAYGLWSIGGVFAPLVCQSIIASGAPWQNFYYGSLVVSAINFALVLYAFRPTQSELFIERKEALSNASPPSTPGTPNSIAENKSFTFPPLETSSTTMLHAPPSKPENTFWRALCLSYTWAFALFGWLECGSETVAQGYTVSYLLAARNADPKTVGYVTSGFAGGLSVGRLLWGYFSPRLTFTQQKYTLNALIRGSRSTRHRFGREFDFAKFHRHRNHRPHVRSPVAGCSYCYQPASSRRGADDGDGYFLCCRQPWFICIPTHGRCDVECKRNSIHAIPYDPSDGGIPRVVGHVSVEIADQVFSKLVLFSCFN
ncbi:hypothetical protein E1B28_001593 [Marasmius oreades]|uniref:Uncharacterized protein n=1 Tax=Marasmius oreades TaxID=181124 RepID=A0A9P7V3U3_9AGAR|nr:uncharacterized protein E1B28_001593 [Marasmius oreades]KAG7099781.1 hypothetical protein E1B28_001593 [Marasmius oreades]